MCEFLRVIPAHFSIFCGFLMCGRRGFGLFCSFLVHRPPLFFWCMASNLAGYLLQKNKICTLVVVYFFYFLAKTA